MLRARPMTPPLPVPAAPARRPLWPVLLYLGWAYTLWSLRVLLLGPWERAHLPGAWGELWYHALRWGIWLAPIALLLRRQGERSLPAALGLWPLPSARGWAVGLGWGALYLVATSALQAALSGPPEDLGALAALGVSGVLLTVLSAAEEELIFRGFLQRDFERRVSPTRAALLTSGLFTAIHWPGLLLKLGPHPAIAILSLALFLLGLVLSLVARRAGSLWPAILVHALNNLLAMLEGG